MNPIWKGYLKINLVMIPVKMYNATKSVSFQFHLLHKDCGTRIKEEITCPKHEKRLSRDEVVRGYQYGKDEYVLISPEDLEKARKENENTMEIVAFVDDREVDPIYYSDSHYFVPDGKPAEEAFVVFLKAMAEEKKTALARAVLRNREHLFSIHPHEGSMLAFTLHYAEEIQDIKSIGEIQKLAKQQVDQKALTMAKTLIQTVGGEFSPEDFVDEYTQTLTKIIKAKIEGKEIQIAPRVEKAKVINLMEALEKSVGAKAAAGKTSQRHAATAGTRKEKSAPRRKTA
jgi:DNA end-binding protein Ku